MKVFELARELNLPSKELIERVRKLGFSVKGNFEVLPEKTVTDVRRKLANAGGSAKKASPKKALKADLVSVEAPEEVDKGGTKTRRRLVSVRSSGEVKRLKVSKPKPKKRDEAPKDKTVAQPPVQEVGVVEEAIERAIPAKAVEPAEMAPTKETPPESIVPPVVVPPVVATHTKDDGKTPEKPRRTFNLPKPVEVSWEDGQNNAWKEVRKGERKRESKEGGDSWRSLRGDPRNIKAGTEKNEWVKPRRNKRSSDGRGKKYSSQTAHPQHTFNARQKAIRLGSVVTVAQLASAIGVKGADIIKKLFELGEAVTMNELIGQTMIELVAADFGVEIEIESVDLEDLVKEEGDIPAAEMETRPPIITIMGHVDHGKTTLLDHLRSSAVAQGEAGGITQHIGAYHIKRKEGEFVFLDTPGHAAFTALRRRGANVTDIVVLIVAADDGIMPQTTEAIEHAKAAKVPIVVAINKIDRPNANVDRSKQQLLEHGLTPEDYGGDIVTAPISAKTGKGIDHLLEMLHLQAELLDLRASHKRRGYGVVIESHMAAGKGPVATMLMGQGELRPGAHFVVGSTWGRVRKMYSDAGNVLKVATPSMPVQVLGCNVLPEPGDRLVVLENEKDARTLAEKRLQQKRAKEIDSKRPVHLQDFMEMPLDAGEMRHLNMVLKVDTQGSLEAIRNALEKEGNEQVSVQVLRAGVGGISETDVSLAAASDAVVMGFNVRPDAKGGDFAKSEDIEINLYTVIYELLDDIHKSLQGMLKPVIREEIVGRCEVRDVFSTSKEGRIVGGYITDGKLERSSVVRIWRDDVLIHNNGEINSLRRFKDNVTQVTSGNECGLRIAKFDNLQTGDLVEVVNRVEETPTLERAGRLS